MRTHRVIAACEIPTPIGIRDKAIVLLLARLGLRAGEVAGLTLGDIDWPNGCFSVIGKNRREAKLPLPQDVGDALLHYWNVARPAVNNPHFGDRLRCPSFRVLPHGPYSGRGSNHHHLAPTSCGIQQPPDCYAKVRHCS